MSEGDVDSSAPQQPTLNKRQLFIRGLPADVTEEEVETYFSECGPVRRAVLIREKRGGGGGGRDPDGKPPAPLLGGPPPPCTGVGFVNYAMEADAATALQSLAGKLFRDQHRLTLDYAIQRTKLPRDLAQEERGLIQQERSRLAKERRSQQRLQLAAVGAGQGKSKKMVAAAVPDTSPVSSSSSSSSMSAAGTAAKATAGASTGTSSLSSASSSSVVRKPGAVPLPLIPETALLLRTVVVEGLKATPVTERVLRRECRQFLRKEVQRERLAASAERRRPGPVPRLEAVQLGKAGSPAGSPEASSRLVLSSAGVAQRVQQHFHHLPLSGTVLRAHLASDQASVVLRNQRRRLILRNVSFKCPEDQLRQHIEERLADVPDGRLEELKYPVDEQGKFRGFAFIRLPTVAAARRALEQLNGLAISDRPIVVDWAAPRDEYLEKKEQQEMAQEENVEDEEQNKDDGKEKEGEEEEDEDDEMDENEQEEEDKEEEEEENDDEQVVSNSEDSSVDEEEEEEEDDDGDHDDNENSENDDDDDEEEVKYLVDTIFIRQLNPMVDEAEVKKVFAQFGPVKYCKIVRDPETGTSRGSAFVGFWEAATASAALDAYLVEQDEGLAGSSAKKGRSLTVSKFAALGARPVLDRAVDRSTIGTLERKRAAERKRLDRKRGGGAVAAAAAAAGGPVRKNLHLLNEGLVLRDSPEARLLTADELRRREEAHHAKKRKLESPNFYVSDRRLSVRQIPKWVTSGALRSLFRKAAVEYLRSNRGGSGGGDGGALDSVRVVQAKVVAGQKNLGPGADRLVSKGFGFVEFADPAHALAALRQANNNANFWPTRNGGQPKKQAVAAAAQKQQQKKQKKGKIADDGDDDDDGGKLLRPIIEFAIEDVRALHLQHQRKLKRAKQQQDAADAKAGTPASSSSAGGAPTAAAKRKGRWSAKRKMEQKKGGKKPDNKHKGGGRKKQRRH